MHRSRIGIVALTVLMLLSLGVSPAPPQTPRLSPRVIAAADSLQQRLEQKLQTWIDSNEWTRGDGNIYTVEIGQLLAYAAERNNELLYSILREYAVSKLVLDDPSDPYTKGFVLWRFRPGSQPDASGTTEGLRVAQGLWRGSKAFGNPVDRALAVSILRGYLRHQIRDAGIWFIRNYFNLGTRAFATNSFMVDYDPDFMQLAAEELSDPSLSEAAKNSYGLVRSAASPAGLLHQIVQPEILTLYPNVNLTVFSPNDYIQVADSCTVAERAVLQVPEAGHRVLAFALKHRRSDTSTLKLFYLGRTGEAAFDAEPELETYACLVRLAVKLKNQEA